jgi:hypothetical protein
VNGRDVLHRLVDDLDEDDAALLASIVDGEKSSAVHAEAHEALRNWLQRLDPQRFAVLSLAVLREQVTAALAAWREKQADAERVRREQVVADVRGSLRMEGLEPSSEADRAAANYVAGRISADELYAQALRRVRAATSG